MEENRVLLSDAQVPEPRVGVCDISSMVSAVLQGDFSTRFFTNIEGDGIELARKLTAVQGEPTYHDESAVGRRFPVKYWYLHRAEAVSEDGEVTAFPRLVLLAPSMESLAVSSRGVLRGLEMLIRACGVGPYDPPIEVEIREGRTAKKRRIYNLFVV